MQDPITTQLISNSWDAIEAAVKDGLAMTNQYGVQQPTLDTVAAMSNEKLSKVTSWHHTQIDGAPAHVRVEKSGDAYDIMHHFELSYHDLHSPDSDKIKEWATAARQFELILTLGHYAQQVPKRSFTASEADPDGWGPRRCVVFNSGGRMTVQWKGSDLERLVRVDAHPVNGVRALVFRIGGGPCVRRPADIALGWTPVNHCKAELLLTEQLEFVNVKPSTIIGIAAT